MRPGLLLAVPRDLWLLLACSLVVNLLALALPLMTMQVYDRILSHRSVDTLIVLSVGVLVAGMVEFILRCCRSMVTGYNGAQFEHQLSCSALEKLLNADPASTQQWTAASMAQDVSAAARLRDYYGGQMTVMLMVDMPFIALFLGLQAYLAGWLALVPCTVLCVFVYLSWKSGERLRALMERRELHDNDRYRFITGMLRAIHSIKALCLEASVSRRFEEVQRESGAVNYNIAGMHGRINSLGYGFAQFMTIAVISVGAPMAVHNDITTGTLIACVLLSGQMMQPLQRGLAMWMRLQDVSLARQRLGRLIALPSRRFVPFEALQPNHGSVRMDNVVFGYQEETPVLNGASLLIQPGDAVAVTGQSGNGKTTLLEVLAGIYAPQRGHVRVCGMEVSCIPVAERARYVAYLPMHGMILRGSIMDNLTGFNPQWRARAREVADLLGIEDAVALLPSGYDTPLEGHMTDVISPGLKQRISVARALLHKPRLVLFDNADHGMDHESYGRIFDLMARLRGKATLVLVSEDRNILSLADHAVELRGGILTPLMEPSPLMAVNRAAYGGRA